MPEKKPRILVLSLMRERVLDDINSQLYDSMRKCAVVSPFIETVKEFKRQMSLSTPSAILVIDSAISKPNFALVLSQLVRYAKSGGTVICACNFSNHLAYDQAKGFFGSWELPWDAGSYLRTTVHRNSRKVPTGVVDTSFANLPQSYSIKSFYLINVHPSQCFYNPSENSHLESRVFHSDLFPVDPQETPCAFAPVGKGFFGYVGDVNAEETSTRAIMVMAQLPLDAVVPDVRSCNNAILATPSGFSAAGPADKSEAEEAGAMSIFTDAVRQAGRDMKSGFKMAKLSDGFLGPSKPGGKGPATQPSATAPGKKSKPRPQRPREAEVIARGAKRALVLERKGNTLFKNGDNLGAIEQYKKAIATRGPHPLIPSKFGCSISEARTRRLAPIALLHDPKHMKARYRRGVTLRHQRQFNRAIEDFEACARLSPNDPQFQKEIAQTKDESSAEAKSIPKQPSVIIPHSLNPSLDDIPIPVPGADDFDSSDFEHEGNGKACRAYNRDGCKAKQKCEFAHAPPSKGIEKKKKNMTTRDELGRNVCNYYLLDECIFSDVAWWISLGDGNKDEAKVDRFKIRMGM
ncbi:hypothetical protein BT96DRAFT_920944 [Gymnopus androsaceus JB14]|uniref:C3H1-type domain-containing protein n=1 Tax=Gymnopus androsaceus JB14 TaxID=1447944 RepID=A0A6A4HL50_9AGAR|nr:hypothetical protein BT96DRAFT_920944 [Gymnopus androsaceus JB14]